VFDPFAEKTCPALVAGSTAINKKEGTPAPAKNYLQPTTTTNGVNTSRAGYAIS
jgi:hypothetical protein